MGDIKIETRLGAIRGATRPNGTQAFLGIPFAAPPVGELRFRHPVPADGWVGVLEATTYRASAPQGKSATPGMAAEGAIAEDCLYLNVFTPAADTKRRPVMVWIHGGAFTLGGASAPIYNGERLSELGDVVVVTINYRLGALGFARIDDEANHALYDMIAALDWVAEHVHSFGGDPECVTLFGESAGAAAIAALLGLPDADGKYHRAIVQSGAAARLGSRDDGVALADALARSVGVDSSGALRRVPWQKIVAAQSTAAQEVRAWGPIHSTEEMPQPPHTRVRSGAAPDVPLLIGTNRDEVRLFTRMANPDPTPIDDAALIERLARQIEPATRARLASIVDVYRKSRESRRLPHTNRDLEDAVLSDYRFRLPCLDLLEAHNARGGDGFNYLFTLESPARRGALGACHALEIPFVFGTADAPTQDRFCGTGAHVDALSRTMMKRWTQFARHGSPNGDGLPEWPRYSAERETMIFGTNTALALAPLDAERKVWV